MLKRSWVEINLGVLLKNYEIYKASINPQMKIMAVIKADAYGHGQTMVAQALQSHGCTNYAVSNINEAILLRQNGISGQILVLGYTPPENAPDLLQYEITQAILSEDYADLMPKGIKAHFAIDTGMNRIGIDADNPDECERIIRKYRSKFELTGLFTHLCVADVSSGKEFTEEQIKKFQAVVQRIEDLHLPFIHCMNSAGGLFYAPFGNLARLGIILYGLKPDRSNSLPKGIMPAMHWKSVISMVKPVFPEEGIGYGLTYRVSKEMIVATVPTGYADGFNRALSNKGQVVIHGKAAPIVGRVCMDQFLVDVTNIKEVHIGDEVSLLDANYTADDMANDIGTIGYEIVCAISKRVPRIYIEE